MDHYQIIKNLHVTCVVLSISGFVLRGVWVLRGSPWTGHRLTRVLPHFVDTTLLVSAVTLLYLSSYRPTGSDWLTFKLLGVLLYIVLGVVALRAGRTAPAGQRVYRCATGLHLCCRCCSDRATLASGLKVYL